MEGFLLNTIDIIVGGIGVSGGTAEEDVQCAQAGFEVFEQYAKGPIKN